MNSSVTPSCPLTRERSLPRFLPESITSRSFTAMYRPPYRFLRLETAWLIHSPFALSPRIDSSTWASVAIMSQSLLLGLVGRKGCETVIAQRSTHSTPQRGPADGAHPG